MASGSIIFGFLLKLTINPARFAKNDRRVQPLVVPDIDFAINVEVCVDRARTFLTTDHAHDRYAPTATLRAAQKKMLSKMALRRPDELRIGMRLGFRGY